MATRKKTADIDAAEIEVPDEGFEENGLFVFDARPVIRNWPAKIKMPANGGEFVTHRFRLDLDYLDYQELAQLHSDIAAFVTGGGKPGCDGDPLLSKLRGWSQIAQQGKGELAYGEAAKMQLLATPRFRSAVLEAYAQMVLGIEEKNSETPPADGQQPGQNRHDRRAAAKAQKGTASPSK